MINLTTESVYRVQGYSLFLTGPENNVFCREQKNIKGSGTGTTRFIVRLSGEGAVNISAWPGGETDFYDKTLILFTLNKILLIYPSVKAHRSASPPWGLTLKL
ncbi:hypothetical protein [Pantoea phytobeneficialis]|uniref:Uncharacterized protein n=1 Tax=Pantoea phytobeneficialis TaxID=2052056 RepID=A0ABT8XSP0_9GAMM|nr:hypothetical protein [Pantoea phytobeneficialis]MDO6405904.1 hypothetical protein [Pantoea phytobeneficialis]